MAQKQKNYKIGDLSKAFSLSNNTLRYYESRGILSPTYEYSSGYRYYDDEQIHMLGSLKKLQNMGLSVDESNTKMGKECQVNIQQPEEAKAFVAFGEGFQSRVNKVLGVDKKGRQLK